MKKTKSRDGKISPCILTVVIIAFVLSCPVSGQEIDVRGKGVSITNTKVSPETSDNTDFGDVITDGSTITRTFTIRNTDAVNPLNLIDPAPHMSLLGDADFTLTKAPVTPIPPGGQTTFDISFDPAAPGQRMAIVYISCDDGGENSFLFSIRGNGFLDDDDNTKLNMPVNTDYNTNSTQGELLSDVGIQTGIPETLELSQNYPNPFNPTTTIGYQISCKSHVTLTVYNIKGQVIQVLVDVTQDAGDHSIRWDASLLEAGVYLYRIQAGEFMKVRKCMLIK